ncbi:MAG TPA: helix-hairpin-helix domain-containing protein [Chloroflexota bacterium]
MARKTHELEAKLSDGERVAWRALQTMPNIGPAMGYDLIRLGMRRPEDLAGRDPGELYEELCRLDGTQHDPCVRDVMAAAVSYAETGDASPWWHFTPERKNRGRG